MLPGTLLCDFEESAWQRVKKKLAMKSFSKVLNNKTKKCQNLWLTLLGVIVKSSNYVFFEF